MLEAQKEWERIAQSTAGWGFSPGTFGELVQGEIGGIPFLITLPIAWGTRATFVSAPGYPLEVWPSHRRKARRAVEMLLTAWEKPIEGVLMIQSTLPVGKGMASSSADIVAACRAVAAHFGRYLPPARIAEISAAIEPTDGIMYDGVVAFDPIRGKLLERLGAPPAMVIVGVLGHGRINTEDHHRRRLDYEPEQERRIQEALDYARAGIKTRDAKLLGQAGRISAEVARERESDPSLDELLQIADDEACGVIIAHSGTVRGVLVSSTVSRVTLRRLEQRLWRLDTGPVYQIGVANPRVGTLSGRLR
ncbi:MAG: GHMP kinase [Sulfobacillus acidophilus]|uniref:GHMP kinase n=1 Tax=Sulfobacillus acidophilus TaxID=53633 RepID=A0A2T2WLD5_9FIRM|nr:MAG: GHMP kinase [Sulfobacillus acidophilus]